MTTPPPLEIVRDEHHRYQVNGESWPGVTSILRATKASANFAVVPPDVLEAKRQFGHQVHEACWALVQGTLQWGALEEDVFERVSAFERYLKERGVKVLEVERLVAHRARKFAGTLDAVGELADGTLIQLDLKTGDPADAAGHLQTAAYQAAWNTTYLDLPLSARECVHLRPGGDYRVIPYDNGPRDFRLFDNLLVAYRCQHPSWRTT